jgi:Butirosin biosynthesis protein H, N-terminal/Domain of unknown function (DUF4872)
MTARKHLKARIRARMARTGEPYVTARRHVVGEAEERRLDHGYRLRGGVHPDTSAVANVLAHHGVIAGHTRAPLTEAMVLGIGGGLGAGFILWEFEAHGSAHVHLVLGFRNRWQYPARWMQTVLDRLAVPATHHETGGARTAARQLDAALAAGCPALATIDCQSIGYWHLPPELEGYGGYPIVVYAQSGDRVHADDRGLAPLTVPRAQLDAARARVGSYKHRLCVIEPDHPELPVDLLRQAVLAGLADAAEHLASSSDSFGLPAWRKWARMMTATRGAKAWAHVFASGRGLAGALLSTYEGIQPVGLYGGHLRGLYSEFLDEAAGLLEEPRLADAATAWRSAAARWQALAEIALPAEPFGRVRELMTEIHAAVIEEGDAGAATAATAATELWALRRTLDTSPPVEPAELFPDMRELLEEIYARETEAAALLPR